MDRGALFLAKTAFNFILMVLVEIVVIPLFWILFNLRILGRYSSFVSRHFIGDRRFLRLGHAVIGGHSEGQSSRAFAAVGFVSTYDPRDLGDNSLYGGYPTCR